MKNKHKTRIVGLYLLATFILVVSSYWYADLEIGNLSFILAEISSYLIYFLTFKLYKHYEKINLTKSHFRKVRKSNSGTDPNRSHWTDLSGWGGGILY